jgi:hypothetical protein
MTALFLVGAKPAGASANRSVNMGGLTAQFTCPTGVQVRAGISFSSDKEKGIQGGIGTITGPAIFDQFNVTGGISNKNSYSLTGNTSLGGSFTECSTFQSVLPFQLTLSGQCGTGVVIHYSDTAGEVGDFVGNVTCT